MTTDPPAANPPDPDELTGPASSDGGLPRDGPAPARGTGGLGAVVNDLDARQESQEWATAQMEKGRSAEEVEADLVAGGWPPDDAADMAEQARKETRHLRGVVTREDVSRNVEADYRKSLRRMPLIAFGGIPGIFITFSNLLRSWAGMRKLRELAEHRDAEDGPPEDRPGG